MFQSFARASAGERASGGSGFADPLDRPRERSPVGNPGPDVPTDRGSGGLRDPLRAFSVPAQGPATLVRRLLLVVDCENGAVVDPDPSSRADHQLLGSSGRRGRGPDRSPGRGSFLCDHRWLGCLASAPQAKPATQGSMGVECDGCRNHSQRSLKESRCAVGHSRR